MNDINLLRPLQEQEHTVAKTRGKNSFYISITIIILIIISVVIFGAKFFLSSQSQTLDSKISGLEREVAEVKSIEDEINNFNNTISQLKGVDKNKITWSTIYDNIAKSTPVDVMLTQVSLISSAASGSSTASSSSTAATLANSKLKITGITKSRRSVALFQSKLQQVGGNFATVDIISSKESQTQTTTAATTTGATEAKIDFEINISLK